jgi:hypothetical protein
MRPAVKYKAVPSRRHNAIKAGMAIQTEGVDLRFEQVSALRSLVGWSA